MNALAGRDWSTWEQIRDVLSLALNRATVAAINAHDNQTGNSDWSAIARDLSAELARVNAHVARRDEVPPDISLDLEYRDINEALAPMAFESDVQNAINSLPFIRPEFTEAAVVAASKPTTNDYLMIGGALAGLGFLGVAWWFLRKR